MLSFAIEMIKKYSSQEKNIEILEEINKLENEQILYINKNLSKYPFYANGKEAFDAFNKKYPYLNQYNLAYNETKKEYYLPNKTRISFISGITYEAIQRLENEINTKIISDLALSFAEYNDYKEVKYHPLRRHLTSMYIYEFLLAPYLEKSKISLEISNILEGDIMKNDTIEVTNYQDIIERTTNKQKISENINKKNNNSST